MRIALDAMGGDLAPAETVRGAVRALAADSDLTVVLVGREEAIRRELDGVEHDAARLEIVHAEEVVGCDESPVEALRRKRDNSIVRSFLLCSEGGADAVVSAGNTGAVVGAGTLIWKLIPGIRKAGIAVTLGTKDRNTVLVDVGANVHCRPVHLLHYGMMAAIYAESVLGHQKPSVALLNIGTEDAKGNDLVRETHQLFRDGPMRYIGHVEGNDIFDHKADVIVCEGFVGNVVLKVSEGLSAKMHERFDEILGGLGDLTSNADTAAMIARLRRATDYAEFGGAPLLGVNGTCMICHGRSDSRAIGNAVVMAARFVRARVVEGIASGLQAHQSPAG